MDSFNSNTWSIQKKIWVWSMFVSWLVSIVVAFWYFEFGRLQPFISEPSHFFRSGGEQLDERLQGRYLAEYRGEKISVIHYWDDSCPCSRFNIAHLQSIIEKFAPAGVHFYLKPVRVSKNTNLTIASLTMAAPESVHQVNQAFSNWIPPAVPSVVVLDHNGRLAYFGPYSLDAVCGKNQSFLDQVLAKLLAGKAVHQIITNAFGCFCNTSAQRNRSL